MSFKEKFEEKKWTIENNNQAKDIKLSVKLDKKNCENNTCSMTKELTKIKNLILDFQKEKKLIDKEAQEIQNSSNKLHRQVSMDSKTSKALTKDSKAFFNSFNSFKVDHIEEEKFSNFSNFDKELISIVAKNKLVILKKIDIKSIDNKQYINDFTSFLQNIRDQKEIPIKKEELNKLVNVNNSDIFDINNIDQEDINNFSLFSNDNNYRNNTNGYDNINYFNENKLQKNYSNDKYIAQLTALIPDLKGFINENEKICLQYLEKYLSKEDADKYDVSKALRGYLMEKFNSETLSINYAIINKKNNNTKKISLNKKYTDKLDDLCTEFYNHLISQNVDNFPNEIECFYNSEKLDLTKTFLYYKFQNNSNIVSYY